MYIDKPSNCLNTLESMIRDSLLLMSILGKARALGISEYYVGAGCIAQVIWNKLSGFEELDGIKDIDLVYFDNSDLTEKTECLFEEKVNALYDDVNLKVDVTNEARVHIWYREKFHYDIEPYSSVEEAIETWPTTASAIGVRLESNDQLKVFAPFGVDDLLGMVVRANKVQITEEIFMFKVKRWSLKWPDLKVISW